MGWTMLKRFILMAIFVFTVSAVAGVLSATLYNPLPENPTLSDRVAHFRNGLANAHVYLEEISDDIDFILRGRK